MTAQGPKPVVRITIAAPAVLAVAAFVWAAWGRFGAPFALEWQEPCMLEHALRVARGQTVYAPPSVEFAPFPYPPLFHYLGALSTSLMGDGLPALRAVSLLGCALATLALFGSGFGFGGLAGTGLLFAAFGWTGFWFDIGRVDSLAMGLIAVSIGAAIRLTSLGRERPKPRLALPLLAGGAAGLAAITKQICLPVGAALALVLLSRRGTRRNGVLFSASWLVAWALPSVWLEGASDGWFSFTVIDLLRGSPWHGPAVVGFWIESAPVLALVLLLVGLNRAAGGGEERSGAALTVAAAWLSLLAAAWAGRAHEGGYDNTLWPLALGTAFAAAYLVQTLLRSGRDGLALAGAAATAGCTLFLFQDPRPQVPTAADRDAYERVSAAVEAIEGDVWQPISSLPSAAPAGVHRMTIIDLLKSREQEVAADFVQQLGAALRERRFAAIVLDGPPVGSWGDLGALIDDHYRFERALGDSGSKDGARLPLTPVTGAPLRPRRILVPR